MKLALGNQLFIEDLSIEDVNSLFVLMNKMEIMKYIPDRFENLNETKEVLEWLISNYTLKEYVRLTYKVVINNQLIGWVTVGPLPSDETKTEIAYVIDPQYWGKGYAKESVKAFIMYLIEKNLITDLYAEVNIANIASQKVLEYNNFKQVKMFTNHDTKETKYLYKIG